MKTTYKVSFIGRKKGAIGMMSQQQASVTLAGVHHTEGEIIRQVYKRYEHIRWFHVFPDPSTEPSPSEEENQ